MAKAKTPSENPSKRDLLIFERAVEVDGQVRSVAKWLVAGMAATAKCHLIGMRDFTAVGIGQMHLPGHKVGAIQAWRDGDVSHCLFLSLEDCDGF